MSLIVLSILFVVVVCSMISVIIMPPGKYCKKCFYYIPCERKCIHLSMNVSEFSSCKHFLK